VDEVKEEMDAVKRREEEARRRKGREMKKK